MADGEHSSKSQSTTAPERLRIDRDAYTIRTADAPPPPENPREQLGKTIPRRPRVSWWLGLLIAIGFAALVIPAITADRWLGSLVDPIVQGEPAPITIRVPPFAGHDTAEGHLTGGGVVVARGTHVTRDQAADAAAVDASRPSGPGPYVAYFMLAFVCAALFAHHMRRSIKGRLLRVQLVSLASIVVLALVVELVMLTTSLSVLVVPVALFAMIPTMALDRVVGLATGILAALVTALLVPFDVNVAILLLVQAATAGLVVAEAPKQRWRAALVAGLVTTLFTVATYVLLAYLTTSALPPLGELPSSLYLAVAAGPLAATLLVVPLLPFYQLLVGEITHGKLVELEDLSNPLLRQIADKAPGTWQHSLMMANMAEIAANAIGANGRLVRVGAYYHDLGKSLTPKYFIENLEPGETSPHDQLPPEVSCDAIFAHVTEGIVAARKAGLHERIVDFMHMHHGNGVLEYFWGKTREQGNPRHLSVEQFRYPGHPPQSRETAILAICDAVEAASRTLKKPDAQSIDSLVQRIVYGKLHLGQLDESGLSMSDLRRVSDSLRETIRHANHGRIEYPWQKAQQDASATKVAEPLTQTGPRLDSLDRPGHRDTTARPAAIPELRESIVMSAEPAPRRTKASDAEALAATADLRKSASLATPAARLSDEELAVVETAPGPLGRRPPVELHDADGKTEAEDEVEQAETQFNADEVEHAETQFNADDVGDDARVSGTAETPVETPAPEGDEELEFGETVFRRDSDVAIPAKPAAPVAPPLDDDDHVAKHTILQFASKRSGSTINPLGPTVPGNEQGGPIVGRPKRPGASVPNTTLPGAPAIVPPAGPPAPARNRAATLPPTPLRRAPSVPPPILADLDNTVTNPPPLRGQPSRLPAMIVEAGPPSFDEPEEDRVTGRRRAMQLKDVEDAGRTEPGMQRIDLRAGVSDPGIELPTNPAIVMPKHDWSRKIAERLDAMMDGDTDDTSSRRSDTARDPESDPHVGESPFGERDEWSIETPVVPVPPAQLRALLGQPDPTREQSLDEIEALHLQSRSVPSEPDILMTRPGVRNPSATREVDPDDIEAAIEIAPPARTRAPSSIGVAKPKKP